MLRQQFAQDVEGAEQHQAQFAADGERLRGEITNSLSQIQQVLEARQDIVETKKQLELLLREASILGSKYDSLEERSGAIDLAENKMDHLTTVIEDIEANLENLKEQRTVIEHVAEKLARLDFALQRAEASTRELREGRALAARIYKSIQQKDRQAAGRSAARETKAAPKPQN